MTRNSTVPRTRMLTLGVIVALLTLLLAACGGGDSGGGIPPMENAAVITTVAPDFTSGQLVLIDLDASTLKPVPVPATKTISDIVADTHGDDFYLIERGGNSRIKKFDLDNPDEFVWSYSAGAGANPYELVFVNDHKAYLLRYNKEKAWIVDPSADTEDEFKIGALDLCSYTPEGGKNSPNVPRMSAGIIVNGKLFITLQRLDSNYNPTNTSCVAVYDVSEKKFVNASPKQSGECGKGIPLKGANPIGILYHEDIGLLVYNWGDSYPPDPERSSIDVIDLETYTAKTLIEATPTTGVITDVAMLDKNTSFFLGYTTHYRKVSLFRFNPQKGKIAERIVEDKDLRAITIGPKGNLWIANAETANPRIVIRDPETGAVIDAVSTDLPPIGIDFAFSDDSNDTGSSP